MKRIAILTDSLERFQNNFDDLSEFAKEAFPEYDGMDIILDCVVTIEDIRGKVFDGRMAHHFIPTENKMRILKEMKFSEEE